MTISDQVARHARKIPDQVAQRFEDDERSYRLLDERVSRLARVLLDKGVGTGDRVALLGSNGLDVIECYLACARVDAICAPLNFRSPQRNSRTCSTTATPQC